MPFHTQREGILRRWIIQRELVSPTTYGDGGGRRSAYLRILKAAWWNSMLPPRIAERFSRIPDEVVGLCRPHSWEELTTPPREGMRPIRDILVHMMSAERYWMRHAILGEPRERLSPEMYADLDAILTEWTPQRNATVAFLGELTPELRTSRRGFPWDRNQTASIEEIVWHVVTHEQYHRGQIFTRLALLGQRDLPDYDMLRRP